MPERLTAEEFINKLNEGKSWTLSLERHDTELEEPFLYVIGSDGISIFLGPAPEVTKEYNEFIISIGDVAMP